MTETGSSGGDDPRGDNGQLTAACANPNAIASFLRLLRPGGQWQLVAIDTKSEHITAEIFTDADAAAAWAVAFNGK